MINKILTSVLIMGLSFFAILGMEKSVTDRLIDAIGAGAERCCMATQPTTVAQVQPPAAAQIPTPEGQTWFDVLSENKGKTAAALGLGAATAVGLYYFCRTGKKKTKKAAAVCAVSDAKLAEAGISTAAGVELLPWQKDLIELLSYAFPNRTIGDIQKEVQTQESGPYAYLADEAFMTKLSKGQFGKLLEVLKSFDKEYLSLAKAEILLNLNAQSQKSTAQAMKDINDLNILLEDKYQLTEPQKSLVRSFTQVQNVYAEQREIADELATSEDPQALLKTILK